MQIFFYVCEPSVASASSYERSLLYIQNFGYRRYGPDMVMLSDGIGDNV